MTRIAWISSLALLSMMAFPGLSQEVLIIDDAMIEGEAREPSVAMFSSRIIPEINAFKLEKSFIENAGRPDPVIIGAAKQQHPDVRISEADSLVNRARILKTEGPQTDNHVSQNGKFNDTK